MLRRLGKLPRGSVLRVAIIAMTVLNITINPNEILLKKTLETQLLKTMAEKYGFVYRFVPPPDREFGRYLNGNWTGMIGMVNREEADIAIGWIDLTYQRSQACDFTIPFDTDHIAILTLVPKENSKDYAAFKPFTLQVWVAILLTLFGNVCALFFVLRVQTAWIPETQASLSRTFWHLFGLICSEGAETKFYQNILSRLVIGLWLMFVLIIQSSYSGTIMSFLTFPGKEMPIRTFNDLAYAIRRKGFKPGIWRGTSYEEILQGLEEDLSIIWTTIVQHPADRITSTDQIYRRVALGRYAFIGSEKYMKHQINERKISFVYYMSPQTEGFQLISTAVRKNYPYKQHLNYITRRAFEAGLFQKWKADETSSVVTGLHRNESKVKPLTVKEIKGLLILYGYGSALAFLVFIAEVLYKRAVCFRNK